MEIAKCKVGVGQVSDLLELIIEAKHFFGISEEVNNSKVMIRQYEYFRYEHCAELFKHLQKYNLPLEIEDKKLTPL